MLSIMRKHAGSWMIKVILFAIVVVFCFFGVNTFRNRQTTYVAQVNGETISYEQYRKTYNSLIEQYRQAYGGNINEEVLKMLRPQEQALNQLIFGALTLQEAQRLDLRVTDQELDDAIQSFPAFQENGGFSQQKANRLLAFNNFSVGDFRDSFRQDIMSNRVRALVYEGVTVTDEEARQWYDWNNAEVNLSYVVFAPETYKDLAPTDEALKAHFESHQEDYKTEPKVKVRYLFFEPKSFEDQVTISDDAVAQYYDDNQNEFSKEKTVSARHILFKVDEKADEELVAQKKKLADDIYQKAKQGEDFAELAKQYSEGPTKEKGGDLGTFPKSRMVKPFADKAFSMQAGEISEPVRTRFGWHIIKVEKVNDAFVEPLDTVKERIRDKLMAARTRALALEKAEMVLDNVFDGDDLFAAGQTFKVPAKEAGPFTSKKPPEEGIGNPRKFTQAAFSLEKMAISEVLDVGNGFCLLQVVEKIDSVVPAFETVADKVREDVVEQMQNDRAKADAQALMDAAAEGASLEEAAKTFNQTKKETGFFKRDGNIPQIGREQDILKAAFELTKSKPMPGEPVKGRSGWYVIRLIERKLPDAEGFAKQKTEISDRLLAQKRQTALQAWLEDLKARSDVEINPEFKDLTQR